MPERTVAEVFPPGEFIKEEIEARGWSQSDLAEILGVNDSVVSALINGKKSVTPDLAKALGAAFETSAQLWMNLESSYRLFHAENTDDVVARKARLYERAPVKELIKRQWIEPSDNITVLEKRVATFLEELPHAARKSTPYGAVTPAQQAWLCRARQLARLVPAANFSEKSMEQALAGIRKLLQTPEEIRNVPRVLGEAGIRFLVLEHLTQTRIDGACLWLDEKSPVIVISLRYDRLDWFWHTVLHELAHVHFRDGLKDKVPLDVDLVGDKAQPRSAKPKEEQQADQYACDFSIKEQELDNFIARVKPFFSRQKITGFAYRLGVHPAIVVGQLQHRGLLPYSTSREILVRVREIVTNAALTDGWGHSAPANL
jgi:HTH-type transcriptional regulator/antitoxin HigA